MKDELEEKAAETLESLTELVTETPEALLEFYTVLRNQVKNDPNAIAELDKLARDFMAKIPDLARVVSDSAKVLETYLTYKTSKRQEEATNSQLAQNAILLKQNRILSYATVILALSNLGLFLVAVILRL